MSTNELSAKVRELKELKTFADEIAAQISAVEDEIKAHMGDQEEIRVDCFKVTWKPVQSSRFDTKAFRAEQPALAERYTVQTTYRRFCVA